MRGALAAVLAAALLLSGCVSRDVEHATGPGAAKVDVDTPQLRAAKRDAGIAGCTPGDGAPARGGMPDLTLPCLGGGPDVHLSSLRGPLVVSLWASWCATCKKEMPVLQAFQERYGDRVPVLGIDYQDVQPAAALALARRTGVTYPLLADPQGSLSARDPFPALRGLPFLALVDADGVVRHVEYGGVASQQDLVDLVREHLGADL